MITPRLSSIMDLVDRKSIADIGTDHAYIPIRLAIDKKIESCIATDKNKGPLCIAQKNIEKYNLTDVIKTRHGAGLSPVEKGEAELIIIAGMGGVLISEIIKNDLEKAKAQPLLLQPMNAQAELRKYLLDSGFKIDKEELSCEGFKVYNILKVSKGQSEKREEIYYHLPKELFSHPLFNMLIDKKEREFNKILKGQKNSKEPVIEIINEYEFLIKELKKIRKELKK